MQNEIIIAKSCGTDRVKILFPDGSVVEELPGYWEWHHGPIPFPFHRCESMNEALHQLMREVFSAAD